MLVDGRGHNAWGRQTMQGKQVADNTTRGGGQKSEASRWLTTLQEGGGRGISQHLQRPQSQLRWQLIAELVVGGGAGGQKRIGRDGWDNKHKKVEIFCKIFFSYIGTHTHLHSCTQRCISFMYGLSIQHYS